MDLGTVATLIAAIAALIGVYITWRKLKPERKVLDSEADQKRADAAQKYQAMLLQSAQREQDLMTRVEALENKMELLEKELGETKKALEDWKNYADRLAHQIRSRGMIPVPFSLERKTRPPNQK